MEGWMTGSLFAGVEEEDFTLDNFLFLQKVKICVRAEDEALYKMVRATRDRSGEFLKVVEDSIEEFNAKQIQAAIAEIARNLEDLNFEGSSDWGPDVLYSFETRATPKPLFSPQIREPQRGEPEYETSQEKSQAGCCLKIHKKILSPRNEKN
ncbi:hypothetical protein SADUNF_Sadunf08G0097700 [Salix dunnii]|uniref:Uncharacterized protein n=1 Tax=Salix dunnii TaxID=1413687 RepID=A0A835JZT5_9ROSI|nr:hypothetical protein SADUNF_Sadunf08G0097700 [Salix dunnii]